MSFSIKNVIGSVAPMLATALGGPLAGQAVSRIAGAMGLKEEAKLDDVQAALASGQLTSDQMIALKKEEDGFKLSMETLELGSVERLAALAQADRASARDREVKTADSTPRILAYVYTAGFFGTLAVEIWIGMKGIAVEPLVAKSIDMLFGVLIGMVLGTKEYYFGTSSSSDKKTDLLAHAPAIKD